MNLGPHRNHHPSSNLKLTQQIFGNIRSTGSNDYLIKRSIIREAFISITKTEIFGPVAYFRKKTFGLFIKLALTLNTIYLRTEFTEHRSLITASRSYFKYLIPFLHFKQFSLECNGIGLRNGLISSYGKCLILVGMVLKATVHKQVARDLSYGRKHLIIGNSLLFNGLYQLLPFALMSVGIFQLGYALIRL